MRFSKMHGIGNNYVYLNLWEEDFSEEQWAPLAVAVANVNTGIGSDGLITIGPSTVADVRMRMFNADGSESENCGNGLRCVGKYVYDKGIVRKKRLIVENGAGLMRLELHCDPTDAFVQEVTVDMGEPRLKRREVPVVSGSGEDTALGDVLEVAGQTLVFTGVSMGNPHAVIFVDDVTQVDVAAIGPLIEHHPYFPERVNVEFVAQQEGAELDFRVWERGSGITQACGTGACASVVAAVLNKRIDRGQQALVHLLGGDLAIRWDDDGHVYMRGPAAWICEGEWFFDQVGQAR